MSTAAPIERPRLRLAVPHSLSWARATLAAVTATAVTLLAWLTGDWWVGGYPGADTNLTIARMTTFGLVFAGTYALPKLLYRVSAAGTVLFVGWTAYLGGWLLAMWPGIFMTDTTDIVNNTRQGIAYEWFSYLHSLIHLVVLDLIPEAAAVGVIQVLATAGLMAYASTTLLRVRRNWPAVIAMNVLAAASAPVVVNTLLESRDTLYSVAHVFLAIYVARAVMLDRRLSRGGLVGIAVLTSALSVYRGDGIALVVVVPLVLLLGLRPPRDAVLRGAGVFVAALIAFHVVLPAALAIQERPHQYELALRLNPLGAVLQTDFYSETKEADLAALSRVIDVEGVKQVSTPVEIPAYWGGKWNQAASDADFAAFEAVSDRLLRDNLGIVAGNRLRTFSAASGLSAGGFTGTAMAGADDRFDWIADRTGMAGEPPVQGLYDVGAKFIRASGEFRGITLRGSALHWNLLPSLLLLLGVLLAFRRVRFEAVIAVILLSRVPLILAAAPASQFKYYYAIHLGGIIVAGLLVARLRPEPFRRALARVRPAGRPTPA